MIDSVIFIFKDPRDGQVRITSTDPGPVLEPLGSVRSIIQAPGGVLLGTVVRLLSTLPADLQGQQGDEAFLEVRIGPLDPSAMLT